MLNCARRSRLRWGTQPALGLVTTVSAVTTDSENRHAIGVSTMTAFTSGLYTYCQDRARQEARLKRRVSKWWKLSTAVGLLLAAGSTAWAGDIIFNKGSGNINAPGAYLGPGAMMGHGNTTNNPRYAGVMIEPGGNYYHTPVTGNESVTVQNGPHNQSVTNPFAEMNRGCFPHCDTPWMLDRQ